MATIKLLGESAMTFKMILKTNSHLVKSGHFFHRRNFLDFTSMKVFEGTNRPKRQTEFTSLLVPFFLLQIWNRLLTWDSFVTLLSELRLKAAG